MENDLAKINEALKLGESIFVNFDRDMMIEGNEAINNISHYTFKYNGINKFFDGRYLTNIIDKRSACIYNIGYLADNTFIYPGRVDVKSIKTICDAYGDNSTICLGCEIETAELLDIENGELYVKDKNIIEYHYHGKNGFLNVYKNDFTILVDEIYSCEFSINIIDYRTVKFVLEEEMEINSLKLKVINNPQSIDIFKNKILGNKVCDKWKISYKTKMMTASLSDYSNSEAHIILYFNNKMLFYDYNDLEIWFYNIICNLTRSEINLNDNKRVDLWCSSIYIGNYSNLGRVVPAKITGSLDINNNEVLFEEMDISIFKCYKFNFSINDKYTFSNSIIELTFDNILKEQLNKTFYANEVTINKSQDIAVMEFEDDQIGTFKFYAKDGFTFGTGQWKNSKEVNASYKNNKIQIQFGEDKGPFNITIVKYIKYMPSPSIVSKDNIYALISHNPVCLIPAPPDVIITDPNGFANIFQDGPPIESTIIVDIGASDGNKIALIAPGNQPVEYYGKIVIDGRMPEYTTIIIKNIKPEGGIIATEALAGLVDIIIDVDGDIDIEI